MAFLAQDADLLAEVALALRFAVPPQPSLAESLAWLGQFRAALERVFLEAGDNLGQALANLGALGGQLRQLETTLGPEAEAALVGLIDEITAHLADLQDDCGAFTSVSEKLRKSVVAIAQQVRELDNVVRTIANISINARIQGNSLVPPRPQVVAFIERLAAMSQESETILAEINDAMASVGLDMGAMEDGQRDLVRELTQTVFPAIEGFTRMSQAMHSSQGDIQQASAELAGQAQKIEAQMGQLIVALQIGDSTRQRLERAEDTLSLAMAQEDAGVKPLAHLALALEQGRWALPRASWAKPWTRCANWTSMPVRCCLARPQRPSPAMHFWPKPPRKAPANVWPKACR